MELKKPGKLKRRKFNRGTEKTGKHQDPDYGQKLAKAMMVIAHAKREARALLNDE